MNRRNFVVVLSSAATLPFAVRAQSSAIPVFGSLLAFSSDTGKTFTNPSARTWKPSATMRVGISKLTSVMRAAKWSVCQRLPQTLLAGSPL